MDRRWLAIPAVVVVVVVALVLRYCGTSEDQLPPQVTVPNPGDPAGAGAVTLDAVAEVFAANADEPWAQVEHSTSVSDGSVVVVNSDPFVPATLDDDPPERDPVPPYSGDEALAACEALVEAFSADTPQVRVEVRHGEEVLVAGDVEGCTTR